MVSENIQHMDVHYWLVIPLAVEQMKAEIIITNTLAANKKKYQKFSLQMLQNSQNHILILFLFE